MNESKVLTLQYNCMFWYLPSDILVGGCEAKMVYHLQFSRCHRLRDGRRTIKKWGRQMPTQMLCERCDQQEPPADLRSHQDASRSPNGNLRLELHARRVLNGAMAERLAEELCEPSDEVVCWRVTGIG